VVARNAVLQRQELPQQLFLRASKQRHVGGAFRPTQHCSQRDDNDVEQIVTGIGRPRVRQASEEPLEFLHWTPPAIRESPSESMLLADATSLSNPHAIPLPRKGGGNDVALFFAPPDMHLSPRRSETCRKSKGRNQMPSLDMLLEEI